MSDPLGPFAGDFTAPHGLPPYGAEGGGPIGAARFPALFRAAIAAHDAEVAAIAASAAPPDFDNTIAALETAGRPLRRVAGMFYTLVGCCSDDAMRAAEREVAPLLARHHARIWMDPGLLARVEDIWARRDASGLDAEALRVLTLYRRDLLRAGARLDADARARMSAIMEELASLGAAFSQNVLADSAGWVLSLGAGDMAGLPDFLVEAAARAARDRGLEGHAITLSLSSINPFLQFSERRDLRETAFKALIARGTGRGAGGADSDNSAIIARIVALRRERARLLGHDNFAAFKLAPQMAGTPDAVRDLLMRVWVPAKARAGEEAAKLAALAAEAGANITLEPWDWRFWSERLRQRDHDLDEAAIKPYFQLDAMIGAAFDCANRLFGLEFRELHGLTLHHPDARAWDVTRDGRHVGLFVGDYFARPSKRSGAWMSALRDQEHFDPAVGEIRPIVLNVMNFSRGGEGEATLLTYEDARTLFHEFGHALHGLMSEVRHPMVSGTHVARDFVELPSQLFEHWLSRPEVLARHALHHRTGAPMPADLSARLLAAKNFNQGFATVEYIASAVVDLETHLAEAVEDFDMQAFEAAALERLGMPREIVMRHASAHFLHVFESDAYSAGYYSYMWSEVMDADAFGAFEEAGDAFDPEVAARLARCIYAAGGRQDPAEAYRAFRGRDPEVAALLRGRGLDGAA